MQYCDVESNVLEFKIVNREGSNTFAVSDVKDLFSHIALYIGSRIVRAWQKDQGPPKTMTIKIRVEID